MKGPSRVSVLLPVHNAAVTLGAALQSVLAKENPTLDVVCVDDGSTDDSWSILRETASGDSRVRIFRRPHRGLVEALNEGLGLCTGALIARMDSDDLWGPGRLDIQRQALTAGSPDLAAVGGKVEIVTPSGPTPGLIRYQAWLDSIRDPGDVWRERYVESPLVHPAAMIRRRWLAAVGGYRAGAFPEDYDLWLRLLSRGARLHNVAPLVLRWVDSPSRLTRSDARYDRRRHVELKARYLAREDLCQRPVIILGAGPTGLHLGRQLTLRGVGVGSYVDVYAGRIGQVIDGKPVMSYERLAGGPTPGAAHLLVAVGTPGGREQVRAFLTAHGYRETRDFTCCA